MMAENYVSRNGESGDNQLSKFLKDGSKPVSWTSHPSTTNQLTNCPRENDTYFSNKTRRKQQKKKKKRMVKVVVQSN